MFKGQINHNIFKELFFFRFQIGSFAFHLKVSKFHQHFTSSFFVQKSFSKIFSIYFVLFLAKEFWCKSWVFNVRKIDPGAIFTDMHLMSSILPISFDQKNEKPKPEAHKPLLYEKAARKI